VVLDYRRSPSGEMVREVDKGSRFSDEDMVVEGWVVPASGSMPGLLTKIVELVLLGPRGWSSSPVPIVGYKGRGQ